MDTLTDIQQRSFLGFMGIRFAVYAFSMAINGFQCLQETTSIKSVNTRFFVFLSYFLFSCFRVAGTGIFFSRPDEYLVGTWYYFCITWGVVFIATAWSFISGFWSITLCIFLKDEFRRSHIKRVLIMAYSTAILFFIYEIPISIICLGRDISLAEAIGFIVFIVVFVIQIFANGAVLIRSLQKHQQESRFANYGPIIFKTKVLVVTLVIAVGVVIIHDSVFNFAVTPEYWHFPVSTLITFFVEIGQMVVVLLILSNGDWKSYIFFKRIRSINSISSSNADSNNNTHNTSKYTSQRFETNSNIASSHVSKSVDIEMENSYGISIEINNGSPEKLETINEVVTSNDSSDDTDKNSI